MRPHTVFNAVLALQATPLHLPPSFPASLQCLQRLSWCKRFATAPSSILLPLQPKEVSPSPDSVW